MRKDILREAAGYLARDRRRRIWKKAVGALACAVVFCTVYALILPAITLEKTPQCGKTEHTHSEACYTQAAAESRRIPVCTVESLDMHEHTDACLDENREYCCGYSNFVVHEHDDSCFDADENLWCPLPEIKAHTHDAGCYTQPETESVHIHTGECYANERGELTCTVPEGEGAHTHSEDAGCYDENGELICQTEESAGHQHTDDCYAWNEILTCQLSTEPAERSLICGKEEIILHKHNADCFDKDDKLICGKTQVLEHVHTEACFQTAEAPALSCDLEEHTHSAACSVIDLAVTVTNEDNSSASVVRWADDTSGAQKRLKAALFSVGQGYAIQSVEYYQITGLTGSKATAAYNSGSGLSPANGAKVFVYDLGADGTAMPQSCAVEGETRDEQADLFTSFNFGIPAESVNAPHIYAFISATPATLEDMGIYPGTEQSNGTWVAYDAASEADANVRATVTLPGGVSAPDGYSLFIRKINEGEGFYPNDKAVSAEAGKVNGWQCYTIRWIMQDQDGLHMKPLNENGAVTVKIEYLKEDAKLSGPAGARKLLIYNSNTDGSLVDQVADTVENVLVADNSYTSFTFQAAHAGPYVFVSKNVEKGYIQALSINTIIDGSAPFDNTDKAGYDSGPGNKIVRSYDTIQYNLDATFAARQEGVTAKTVNMYFELTLRKSATAAKFDISKMLWLGENYSIEYLDDEGNVIMVMAHDGEYYLPKMENGEVVRDDHGFALPDKTRGTVSMNAQVSGSTAEANSYKVASGGVVMQRLVGCTTLTAGENQSILAGTQSFPMAVEVRNADNGETFAPAFRMWLEGNEENYGEEKASPDGGLEPAQPDTDNVVDISKPENAQYLVTVSAGTNFNVQLKKNNDMSYKNWFDFSSGKAVKESTRTELERLAKLPENHGKSNPAKFTDGGVALSPEKQAEYANYRYGRMTCYGITLQLYNHTDNETESKPGENLAAKGLRGLSLPVGDITFDLNFSSTATAGDSTITSDAYTPILWDYNENVPANNSYTNVYVDPGRGTVTTPSDGKGNGGRNLYWDGESRSAYAKGGGPSNYKAYHNGCYYGGDWALTDGNGNKADISAVANPSIVTGNGGSTTYHFSVSDYDFDFDDQYFPTRDAGNSGNIPGYDTYARCFSAGCVQVLSVFPRVQKVSEAEIFLNTTVSNLELETRAGQKLKAQEGDDTKIQHEVNKNDNTRRDQIVLYAPGNLTKGSSFNGLYKGNPPKTTTDGFLGTEYWTTSYDCSAFAGDNIWIISYGLMASGSDYRMRSMNLLQLFDSRALSIRGTPDVYQDWDKTYDKKGEATFLYAADPDYPNGYDTNHKDKNNKYDVLAYMNSVREEDLRYYTSLDALKADGFTCVGVLMELRNCDLLGGKYQYMRIPVKVNGDDENLVSKTVATVNTFRVWSEDLVDKNGKTITWANGHWNGTENVLAGFPNPTNSIKDDKYSGELANGKNSPPKYVKTEYEDGLQVKGTHAGGTLSGNSLLILSYKAGINIGVSNKESTGMISYNLGDGESVVDYRLKNIRTEISDLTGQTDKPVTDLTIKTVLDEGYTGGTQRISVSGGSYRISGYAVDASGAVAGEEASIAIGTDPMNPTVLEFDGSDGNRHRIKVYAQMGANGQSVKFVIQDAPVGLHLPDITFQANFAAVTVLKNNDTIKTSTYISGTSDNRAYDQTKGNTDNITVGVVLRSGTNLTKAVNTRYIELDGTIIYDVTYTNSGADTIGKIYFYDLLPENGDIRGSDFSGDVVLGEFDVISSEKDGAQPADATIYYSGIEYKTLYDKVSKFGEGKTPADKVDDVEAMLKDEKWFKPLARVENGKLTYDSAFNDMTPAEITELMSHITGLYAKVENLHEGQTVTLRITLQTKNNAADDWYKNIANSWIAGSETLPLTSNKVETQVVSRSISGVVWHDKNLNGIRDEGEPLLENVEATLFKKGADDAYAICEKDVTGKDISPVTTGTDGAYSFDMLAEGDYIVAFSGAALEKFTGATAYQQNGQNDANTNDGKAISELTVEGINKDQYTYFIRYSVDSESMLLHSIKQMGNVSLVNGVEMYSNQDLGLIAATHELPETGGTGTAPYIIGGLLLMTASAIFLQYRRKRGRKEDFASS